MTNQKRDKTTNPKREEIIEILGLETAPDGEREVLLIRDEGGVVVNGIPFTEEVDKLLLLLTQQRQLGEKAGVEKGKERIRKLLELALKGEKLSGMTLFKLNQIITNDNSK